MHTEASRTLADSQSPHCSEEQYPWLNPTGGLGDILMISGVLKLVVDKNPAKLFNLVRRSIYQSILKDHPAIKLIGYPPKNAVIIGTDYWSREKLGPGDQRAFQIIARSFQLSTPVEEKLYLPGNLNQDDLLFQYLPLKAGKNLVIAPYSDSPRKMMPLARWEAIVESLAKEGYVILQVGKSNEVPIRGAYSLLGLTTPQQLVSLLARCNAVITVDNFVMHCSHLAGTPAVVLWGPTDPCVYGYSGQIHISPSNDFCKLKDKCLGPEYPENYPTGCPTEADHCLKSISLEEVKNAVRNII